MENASGIIKSLNFESGLGYIIGSNGEEYVFVTKGLEQKVGRDIPVSFDVQQTRTGKIAVRVAPKIKRN